MGKEKEKEQMPESDTMLDVTNLKALVSPTFISELKRDRPYCHGCQIEDQAKRMRTETLCDNQTRTSP